MTAPQRIQLLGRLHRAAKLAGLDEDAYRDRLEREFGVRSAKDLSEPQLERAVSLFHGKRVSPAVHAHHAKIKALFIAAHNLGALDNGTDAALDAFVARQTGKQRLGFVTPSEAASVTEALKAILAREGFAVRDSNDGGLKVRREMLKAQWAKLHALGAVKTDYPSALWHYAGRLLNVNCAGLDGLTARQLDTVSRRLGGWIRQRQAARTLAA